MSNDRHTRIGQGPRRDDVFDVDEEKIHRETIRAIKSDTATGTGERPTAGDASSAADASPEGDGTADQSEEDAPVSGAAPAESDGHPYIKITPARKQVTPKQVVKGLFGFYRAGQGRSFPLGLEQYLPLVTPQSTFEFLIHKPAAARRFDFYIGVHPYSPTAFKNLASNLSAMYPGAFTFEVVSFAPEAAFDSEQDEYGGAASLADREGIEDLASFNQIDLGAADPSQDAPGGAAAGDEFSDPTAALPADGPPAMARWVGVETETDDYMTLLTRFTEVAIDSDDGYRSPLSVLLEQAVGTEAPFLYQVVWTPRPDWTKQAETRKRNLKLGYTGPFDAFLTELVRFLTGAGEAERRQRHRPSTPEQIGGTVSAGPDDDASQLSRMEQIDVKQPAVTFDVSIRAAGAEGVIGSVTGALNSLSGPYYGLKGKQLGQDTRAFRRLCNADLAYTFRGRFGDTDPVIVASPNELASFVSVPHTEALPQASRGASGGTPDARSPLTATDEDLLAKFETGMHVGNAVTAPPSRDNIPIHLTAEQLVQHVLRTGTTGSGKTTAMINDALSAYEAFDGPIFLFDKKGGSLCEEYKRAHFKRYGDLDDVIHLPVPGPNGETPAFALFDIRPQLAAGMPRETAVQEKVDRFNELLRYVVGEEAHDQAFVAREILNSLIEALFDPVNGSDAFEISDLLNAAHRMQKHGVIPPVSDDDLKKALERHFDSDKYRFETSIDAVMNRLTKLRERDFVWRVLNFIPEWDEDRQQYAVDQMLFDLDAILDSTKVVLLDPGDLRPQSRNLFSVLVLDYIWSHVRLRRRWDAEVPTPADGYLINLIIDEAAPIMQTALVRNEMIQDAREFALSFEIIVHFAEQVKKDELDTKAYKELLRNFNTKLIGKLGIDRELARMLFHEELDVDELFDRTASMPRGEVVGQLPDTGFMTDTPELVTLRPLPIPAGHSDSDTPVDDDTPSPTSPTTFGMAAQQQWEQTRLSYCLIPGVNSSKSAAQRAADGRGAVNGGDAEPGSGEDADDDGEPDASTDDGAETGSSEEAATSAGADEWTPSPADDENESVETDATDSDADTDGPASDGAAGDTQGEDEGAATESDESDALGTRNEYGGHLGTVELSDSDAAADGDGSGDAESDSPRGSDGDQDADPSDDLEVAGSGSGDETSDGSASAGGSAATQSVPDRETDSSAETPTTMNDEQVDKSGSRNRDEQPSSNGDREEHSTDDLTIEERTFLRDIIKGLNRELEWYELTDSMVEIRNRAGSQVDEAKLVENGYLEKHRVNRKRYYWVTRKGQRAVNRRVYFGRSQGDLHEKVHHKVFVEYFARYLQQIKDLHVKKYYEPIEGGKVFDVAGFREGSDGTLDMIVIGEVITHVKAERVIKHYDDFAKLPDVRKFWIVKSTDTAHELLESLEAADRIESTPYKSTKNYTEITKIAFGDTDEWLVIGAANIIERVKNYNPDEGEK